MKVLITGSSGLVGSQAVEFYSQDNNEVIGIDNDMRSYFFGKEASTSSVMKHLEKKYPDNYVHFFIDIRDEDKIKELYRKKGPFDLIIHAAAQPSHDWAKKEPLTDFSINATGTFILLENFRKYSPGACFIYVSSNKVYGDTPNRLPFIENKTRYDLPKNHNYFKGIDESMSIDNSKHSLMGVSKLSADIMTQEYGKYFNLKTGVFRGGCITGAAHSGAVLHGFLSYLVKCILNEKQYTIFGYKGKQVRDNIHAYDLVNAFNHFYRNPRKGEVYNIGGSRHSNVSILEAIHKIEEMGGKKAKINLGDEARKGDHKWYISDVSKFKKHYPNWDYKFSMNDILKDLVKNHT